MTTDDGKKVEYSHTRGDRPTHVVPVSSMWKTFLAVLGLLAVFSVWALDARIKQQIGLHALDGNAHFALVRVIDAQIASDKAKDTEIRRLTAQIDALQKEVRELRDVIGDLKTTLRSERGRR